MLAILRVLASAAVAGLAAAYTQYPHLTWIQIALTAFGVLGIHAIPAVGQQPAVTPLKAMEVHGVPGTIPVTQQPPVSWFEGAPPNPPRTAPSAEPLPEAPPAPPAATP